MSKNYFTEKDLTIKRQAYYNFYRDEENGGLRAFNGLNEELTLKEVKEIIAGLTTSYIRISDKEYKERTLDQIKNDVDYSFSEFNQGPPLKKQFRKDLKRHYSIECVNCLKEISTKTDEGYWMAQNWHKQIHGEKFCSEWCVNKYIDEIKQNTIKEKKVRYEL
ncbi:hypothetical protein [Cytobacillus gottheilii]|uniref:hypothetical protein n=1 Tax=Cytobacillus gottheilii TaxID=859144 RepID=UPI000830383C|nr:hypothetical protein [Cytobacillus gottheilii]